MAVTGLMMIHIVGYDGDPEEYFEGIGASDLSVAGELSTTTTTTTPIPVSGEPTIPGTSLPVAPLPDDRSWWQKLIDDLTGAWPGLKRWRESQTPAAEPPEDDETTRSLRGSRMLPALLAGGALATIPPAAVALAAASTIFAITKEITEAVADDIDLSSERWRLWGIERKLEKIGEALQDAFLRFGVDSEGVDLNISLVNEIREILEDAFLRLGVDAEDLDTNVSLIKEIRDALEGMKTDNVGIKEAIERFQMEVDFADGKASFKSGVFEY